MRASGLNTNNRQPPCNPRLKTGHDYYPSMVKKTTSKKNSTRVIRAKTMRTKAAKISAKKVAVKKSDSLSSLTLRRFKIVDVPQNLFGVEIDGKPLVTSLGGRHSVHHSSLRFLEHLVHELCERGKLVVKDGEIESPKGFDSYSLLGLQREWIASETDNFSQGFVGELICDRTLERPSLPIYLQQYGAYTAAEHWLSTLGARLVDLDLVDLNKVEGVPDSYTRLSNNMGNEDTQDFLELVRVLTDVFKQMSPQQKAATVYLSNITHSSPIFSMCVIVGGCTTADYGLGIAVRSAGEISTRALTKHTKQMEEIAAKAVRFVELASGEINRPTSKK
jgi:hypothetical protein